MIRYFLNIAIAFDSLVASIFGAHPGETISSMAYRAELRGMHFRYARPVIDWLFATFENAHCKAAYDYAYTKRNLPEDMR